MQSITSFRRRVGTSPALLWIAILLIAGCREASVTEPPATTPTVPLSPITPTGGDSLSIWGLMTQQAQSIRVTRGGAAVTDAEVTVNGVRLTHCCGDLYEGSLPEPVRAGDMLKLKVVAGGVTFEAPGEVAPTPTIIAPAAGSTIARNDPVSVLWNSPVDPDYFEVCLNCWANALEGALYLTSGSARQFEIAPGTLVDYGTGTILAVYAYKTNFLKYNGPAKVRLSVSYVARSRDAIITVK